MKHHPQTQGKCLETSLQFTSLDSLQAGIEKKFYQFNTGNNKAFLMDGKGNVYRYMKIDEQKNKVVLHLSQFDQPGYEHI